MIAKSYCVNVATVMSALLTLSCRSGTLASGLDGDTTEDQGSGAPVAWHAVVDVSVADSGGGPVPGARVTTIYLARRAYFIDTVGVVDCITNAAGECRTALSAPMGGSHPVIARLALSPGSEDRGSVEWMAAPALPTVLRLVR